MLGAWLARRRSRAAFEALNRGDVDALLSNWAEDATFVYPGRVSASGQHTGKETLRAWFDRWLDRFPSVHFTVRDVAVTRPFDLFGNNVVFVHWDIDVTTREGASGRNSGVSVITVARGTVVHVKDYIFDTGPTFRAAWGEVGGPGSP